jgi:hypothetical protein
MENVKIPNVENFPTALWSARISPWGLVLPWTKNPPVWNNNTVLSNK